MGDQSSFKVGYFFPTAIGVCDELLAVDELDAIQQSCNVVQSSIPNSVNSNWLSDTQSPFNTMNTLNIADDQRFELLYLEKDTLLRLDIFSIYQHYKRR